MTIHEIAHQLYNLSIDGFINGEKFSRRELEDAIKRWMTNPEKLRIPNRYVIEISLRDGRWFATIDKVPGGYDYTIPDTREEEARLIEQLIG